MLPEALRPPLSQLWKVDIYCEKWLEMALIYPCLGNRASERHPHMAPEQCQAVAHKMHAMLRANPFFWGALEHRACVPTPILQRLLFSVVAAYLANPQFETDSKMIRLALEIFEQELVIPPESYRPFLLLVVEFRTILLARDMTKDSSNNSSGQDSNDGNQLELDFKRPLPSAHQASEHLPSYLAALNSRWEAIDEMIADGQDLIAAFSMHNFIQECKYGLAAMAIELNTLYPSGVVRDMVP